MKIKQLNRIRNALENSRVYLGLFSEESLKDPQFLIEFALGVILDKQIYLVIPEELVLSDNMIRLARMIRRYKSPEDIELVMKDMLEEWNNLNK